MIKYFKELENRNNYYLPLVENSMNTSTDIYNFKLPISFYEKYKQIFIDIKTLNIFIKTLDINKLNFFNYTYEELDSLIVQVQGIKEDSWIIKEMEKIIVSDRDIVYNLRYYIDVIRVLIDLYPNNTIYKEMLNRFENAYKETEKYRKIECKVSNIRDVYLPDAWFITPYNDLYNTGGPGGHKETNMVYSFENIVKECINGNSLIGTSSKLINEKRKIEQNKSINRVNFKKYLHCEYEFVSLDKDKNYFERTTHDKHIIDTVKGVISAEAGLYAFFENLQKYCKNPKKELEKILELTKNDFNDILVRCCGFHKVESMVEKTITTSIVNYQEEFSEYIANGWKSEFIPPIIIRRDIGDVAELDMDSFIVKKVLSKKIRK